VPPLRERRDDIPALIDHILTLTPGGESAELSTETIELMMRHDWPGNVRELRNVIERAVLLSEAPASEEAFRRTYVPGAVVPSEPKTDRDALVPATTDPAPAAASNLVSMAIDIHTPFKIAKRDLIAEFERRFISLLLEEHNGNISAAARAAGIDRMSIHKMLNRLGLDNPGRGG